MDRRREDRMKLRKCKFQILILQHFYLNLITYRNSKRCNESKLQKKSRQLSEGDKSLANRKI